MRNKYFFLIFLVNLSFLPFLNAEEMLKREILIVDLKMTPEVLVMGTEFFRNLDIESVKEIGSLTGKLIEGLDKELPFMDIERMQNGEKNNEKSKPLVVLIKRGKIHGADYIAFGNIDLIELKKKKYEFEELGQRDAFYGRYTVTLRIIDVNNEKVIYADKISQTEIECINEDNISGEIAFIKKLKDNILNQLIVRITETISPLRVLKAMDGYAYLENRQSTQLKRGMKVGVYIPSRPSTDKNTGEIIGDMEYLIAELKVIEVSPKEIRAQIIKYSRPIETGMIYRTIIEPENKSCSR